MKRVLTHHAGRIALILLLFGAVCSVAAAAGATASDEDQPSGKKAAGADGRDAGQFIWRGKRLAEKIGCLACHGWLGSYGRTAPDLLGMTRGRKTAEILAALWNHVPHMARKVRTGWGFPTMSAADLRALMNLFLAMDYIGLPGDADRGLRTLAERGCLACHTLSNDRQAIAPTLADPYLSGSPAALVTALFNHYTGMVATLHKHGRRWPRWNASDLPDIGAALRGMVPPDVHPQLLRPGRPAAGRRQFERLGCSACHAARNASESKPWAGRSAAANGAALLNHIGRVRSTARARGVEQLSENEAADLLAFLTWDTVGLVGGDAARGWRVFRERRCVQCHRPKAEGGISKPYQELATFDDPFAVGAQMFSHGLDMTTATRLRNVPWPRLTVVDVRDLVAFLAPQAPRR
ncbi:MAG: c-type cytochrome [Acidobacteriota bacterium]